eukprot:CAMPEP_0196600594 /NCGR_PEP_ID=MMETSP1081-20130531/95468_1 /TAXON_ID=36882 /ORGANISM="Pyramimonas amylifera, Strain CCMP720" /LENGTH=385 /DNA_ID=CAMNT_0041926437 /DNA_START=383 /DNA_END=1540 /DNA_ORIENTATION=-
MVGIVVDTFCAVKDEYAGTPTILDDISKIYMFMVYSILAWKKGDFHGQEKLTALLHSSKRTGEIKSYSKSHKKLTRSAVIGEHVLQRRLRKSSTEAKLVQLYAYDETLQLSSIDSNKRTVRLAAFGVQAASNNIVSHLNEGHSNIVKHIIKEMNLQISKRLSTDMTDATVRNMHILRAADEQGKEGVLHQLKLLHQKLYTQEATAFGRENLKLRAVLSLFKANDLLLEIGDMRPAVSEVLVQGFRFEIDLETGKELEHKYKEAVKRSKKWSKKAYKKILDITRSQVIKLVAWQKQMAYDQSKILRKLASHFVRADYLQKKKMKKRHTTQKAKQGTRIVPVEDFLAKKSMPENDSGFSSLNPRVHKELSNSSVRPIVEMKLNASIM